MSEIFATTGTIAAIATAVVPQQGSVSIVRVSGSEAMAIAKTLFHTPGRQVWESHRILYGYIRHPQTQQLIDEALLLIMQAPRSYTREDVVEFHCHGGMIAVSLLALSFGSWMIKAEIPQLQQINLNFNQEDSAIANFKAAQNLGLEASGLVQSPPHPLIIWQQAESKWQEAIKLLESIPENTSVSAQAKDKLIRYRFYHTAISQRVIAEKQALANLETAHKLAIEAHFFIESSPHSLSVRQQAKDKWQQAINLLKAIPKNAFVYPQAKETLANYQSNYKEISRK